MLLDCRTAIVLRMAFANLERSRILASALGVSFKASQTLIKVCIGLFTTLVPSNDLLQSSSSYIKISLRRLLGFLLQCTQHIDRI